MYRTGPPTAVKGFIFAVVGGVALALGHLVGGLILVGAALICAWAVDRTRRDGDDHSGLY